MNESMNKLVPVILASECPTALANLKLFIGDFTHEKLLRSYVDCVRPKGIQYFAVKYFNINDLLHSKIVNTDLEYQVRQLTDEDYQHMKQAVEYKGQVRCVWNADTIEEFSFACEYGLTYAKLKSVVDFAAEYIQKHYGDAVKIQYQDSTSIMLELPENCTC